MAIQIYTKYGTLFNKMKNSVYFYLRAMLVAALRLDLCSFDEKNENIISLTKKGFGVFKRERVTAGINICPSKSKQPEKKIRHDEL